MKFPKKSISYKESLSFLNDAQLIITHGDEKFYREQIKNKIISNHSDKRVVKIDAEETEFSDFADQLLFRDLFGEKRIFIIENFNKIEKLDFFAENKLEDIYILDANKITSAKLDPLKGIALIIETKRPPTWEEENDIISKIKGSFKNKNYEIDDNTAKYLYNFIGYNLYKLSNEISKIIVYKEGNTSPITKSDVDAIGISNVKYNIFDLINFLIKNDKKEALTLLDKIFKYQNNPSILLISNWYSHFEKLLYIKTINKKVTEISDYMGIHTFIIDTKLKPQAAALSVNKILQAIKNLADIELKVKKSNIDIKFFLEKFILNF